jgi:N-acetylglucosamine-6-phosphate deacetylase
MTASPSPAPVRIAAERVCTPDGCTDAQVVVIVDGIIAAIEPPHDGDTIQRGTLTPGLIDLQINGIDDIDFWNADGADWDRADHLLARHGVTSYLATLVSAPIDDYPAATARITAAIQRRNSGVIGLHLEGPFLGDQLGAHNGAQRLDIAHHRHFFDDFGEHLRLVTVGPEQPAMPEVIAELCARRIAVAIGHTSATAAQITAAVDAGARLFTHLFNASGPLHHRAASAVTTALLDDRLACSLIADLHHVHRDWLAIAGRLKPVHQLVAVSDAVAWQASSAGPVALAMVDGAPRLRDGTLAGSALWLDDAIAHLIDDAGWPLDLAVRAATGNPAELLGLSDRGVIEPGRRADLALMGNGPPVTSMAHCVGHCTATWRAGRQIWTAS